MKNKPKSKRILINYGLLIMLVFWGGCSDYDPAITQKEYNFQNDGISAEITLSPEKLKTSDVLEMTMTIRYPDKLKIRLPEKNSMPELVSSGVAQEQPQTFALIETHDSIPVLYEQGKLKQTRRILLQPGLPGIYRIPPMEISAYRGKEQLKELKIPALNIQVSSVLPAKLQSPSLRPIAPNIPATADKTIIYLSCLIIGGITAFVLIAFARNKNPATVPPREVALKSLTEINHTDAKTVMSDLDKIILTFFTAKLHIREPVPTNDVLLRFLEKKNVSKEQIKKIHSLIKKYDEMRFGNKKIIPEQTEKLVAKFAKLIEEFEI